MRLVLDKLEEMNPGNMQLKQFAGDLANTLKSSYESKIRPVTTGGTSGAGMAGSSFLEGLGLTGIAKTYKENAEKKEQKRQDKEQFVGDFQKYSDAGQNLSVDTSRQVAESLFEEIASKRDELKKLQEEEARIREAGYKVSEENLAKQKELVDALKNIDPKSADKGEGSKDQSLTQIQSSEKEMEAAEVATEHFEVQKKEQEDITALYTITDDHFKKMDKRTEEMLEALKTIAEKDMGGGGGLLSSAAEMAGDLMGNKGKAGGATKAGKVASAAGKFGKFAKVGGGLLAVGTAAYEGYTGYQDAEEKVKSGEITKEEGQVEKGKAVGGAVGGGGGALAGAAAGAAIGSVVPVVGTAIGGLIGGAIGYWGGKKAGQAVGEVGVKGYQAVSGPSGETTSFAGEKFDPKAGLTPKQMKEAAKVTSAGEKLPKDVEAVYNSQMSSSQTNTQNVSNVAAAVAPAPTPPPQVTPPTSSFELKTASRQVARAQEAVEAKQAAPTNNMVNAPVTNVVNSSGGSEKPTTKDTRNIETTFQKYLDRRYYPAR